MKRKDQILSIARSALLTDGYDQFVVREIARKAGITLGNLQYHFSSKETLIEAIAQQELQTNLKIVHLEQTSDMSLSLYLEKFVTAIILQWQTDGAKIFAVVSMLALHQKRFRIVHAKIYQDFYDGLGQQLSAYFPELPAHILQQRVRLMTALLDGAVFQIPLPGETGHMTNNDPFMRQLVDCVLLVLQPRGAAIKK